MKKKNPGVSKTKNNSGIFKEIAFILANKKNKIAREIGFKLLLLLAPVLMAVSCGQENCDFETNALNTAQNNETRINKDFNINADSCINYYGAQMPQAFLNTAYGNLSANAIKADSVTAITGRANDVIPMVPETDPKYPVLQGISRTGGKALDSWDEYLNAQNNTENAQNALTKCENSK